MQKDLTDKIGESIATAIFMAIPIVNILVPFAINKIYRDDAKKEVDSCFSMLRVDEYKRIDEIIDFLKNQK